MNLAQVTVDPASIVIATTTIVTWLLGLSYLLGRYVSDLKTNSKATEKLESAAREAVDGLRREYLDTVKAIYAELKELSKGIPHVCQQVATIESLKFTSDSNTRRVAELEKAIERVKRMKAYNETHQEDEAKP